MSGPRSRAAGGLGSWVEEEGRSQVFPLQSAAQPRRCALRGRKARGARIQAAGEGGRPGDERGWGAPSAVRLLSTLPPPALGLLLQLQVPLPELSTRGGCVSSTLLCLSIAQDTPDPWQGLDPFDSPDSKPFQEGHLAARAWPLGTGGGGWIHPA